MLPLHHKPVEVLNRRTLVERASPKWRYAFLKCSALPAELHPQREHARLESNQRPLPSQSSALPLSYERVKEPPAGVEPAPRPYKGRVLAVDTTEARNNGDGRSRTDILLVASEALVRLSYIPRETKCGRVESNHHSQRRQGYNLLSSPLLSVRARRRAADRTRTGTARLTTSSACRYTTATTNGDDRVRTGGLSPDKRVLCLLSYAP